MPVYNCRSTIDRAFHSVINQTYKQIEFIIIDGGSTDGTFEIMKSYENRFHFLLNESDKGVYDAMNKGVKIATGK